MLFHKPVRWWFPDPIFPNAHEPTGSFAHVQNLSRISLMRWILSFHGFLLLLDFYRISLRLTARDCLKRREYPSKSMRLGAHNPRRQDKNPWKNRSVASAFYPWFSLNACGRREARSTWWCIKDDRLSQCSWAYGLIRTRSKSITDITDAMDFIFSRISFTLGFL